MFKCGLLTLLMYCLGNGGGSKQTNLGAKQRNSKGGGLTINKKHTVSYCLLQNKGIYILDFSDNTHIDRLDRS